MGLKKQKDTSCLNIGKVGNKGPYIAEGSMNRVPSFSVKGPKTYEKNTMSEGLQNLIFGSGDTLKTVDYFSKFKKKT